MRIKYIGPDMGATGPRNGGVYDVTEIVDEAAGVIRVVDECLSDFNYDDDPNWLPGYLYSATEPFEYGKFYIVEDDENGSLAKLGLTPAPN